MLDHYPLQDILKSDIWDEVGVNLLAKMISEFMYEEIIHPIMTKETEDRTVYQLVLKDRESGQEIRYQFEGKKRLMDSYRIYSDTIWCMRNGNWEKMRNPLQFILDIQETVGMKPGTTGHLIKEYNNTLLADAHILQKKQKQSVEELTSMDYAELEGEMEGHPWITYNKGRIGFNYQEYLSYSPEQKKKVKLLWVAVHKEYATFHSIAGLDYERLIKKELGNNKFERFRERLKNEDVEVSAFYFLPVHEWQWNNMIIQYFPEDIAQKRIVSLGEGDDEYLPQQSIRTFVNTMNKNKHHVKLPMSILNTLVYRGLPGERTVVAPIITDYIHSIRDQDAFLRDECRIILPGEVASINYEHPYYSKLDGAPYQYLEMLGAIWRESIYSFLEEGERPITLASLLYVDNAGKPYVALLIEQSGLTVDEWVKKLFNVLLPPLLHYLYKYGTVFSPHGQNTVLVLKDNIPHRLAMKDFVDDVNISKEPLPELRFLPKELKSVLRSEEPEGVCQFIFTGLFVCHFRYLTNILDTYYHFEEERFWLSLREMILNYQNQFPELEERFRLFDLLKPSYTKLCLNRNRMIDYGYEDDHDRPHASEFGKVQNPLHLVGSKR
ncbi:IucA/IucC family protein [Halalkalibacter nanhaiisediminis]|uniref:Siderophore synthetase component n=1 Tax=Halalkalibacter nanhaiisediminis TaxID=688079 RepID=A0A562QBJ4_9BACI|nr:IucA/IucC family siderophore biosynthesis protein [Halalkalibacter nanhaiisediminis]TWI54108.1 siderophore synthetase component [Halalkalibacter nanhaiisediminis]